MKYLLILLFFISGFAYTETVEHKNILSQLVRHYNASDYQNIFALYSSDMKTAVPLTNNNDYFVGLKSQNGDIKTVELSGSLGISTSNYKAVFENSIFSIKLTLNKDRKIKGLKITPFIEQSKKQTIKPASNKINKIETFLNEKQLNIIFDHSLLFPNNTQISFAFIKDSTVQYFGLMRKNDELIVIDNHNKVFEIGSITKVFTATILANFVNNEKLTLNDTIDNYLGIKFKNNAQISFKELASHHSGLPRMPSNFATFITDANNPFKGYGVDQLTEYLERELTLDDKPFNYSNIGAGLLGYTLSKISNKSYQQLLDEVVFKPFDMLNSTTDRKTIEPLLIKGLNANGEVTLNWDLNVLSGAGSILSTVEDLAKFARAQFDQTNKDLALTRRETNSAGSKSIGLGWFINKKLSGNDIYEHNGGTGGYRSAMLVIPKIQEAIIILSNVSAFNQNNRHIDNLAYDLMKTL